MPWEDAAHELYVESMGTTLATHILRALFKADARALPRGGFPERTTASLTRYIDEHFADKLGLATLARVCNMSSEPVQINL